MASPAASPSQPISSPPPNVEATENEAGHEQVDAHEQEVEQREAYEYWGYLFKPDKTGTDKLKGLLRGLKDLMNQLYEPSDNLDLTPNQLAHFYRDLHGNYDQLFLGTPSESIAFIYKSLGCLHSLQPLYHTHQTAFTDPTVPALKTEGWIMWQTIQLLLGPEEHSSFLREAVAKWDVKDHDTGKLFPKILPRECFPLEPDKHMVAWYEGVSERLRREAEEEERKKRIEVEHDPDEPEPRRLHARFPPPRHEGEILTDEEGSIDSRGPALAYFNNPLYRHVDGRPSIIRRNSKRPALSPRQTMMYKGKAAAATFGRIARNVGSPHLWSHDSGPHSRSHSKDPGQHERRKSHSGSRHHGAGRADLQPTSCSYDERHEHRAHSSSHPHSTYGVGSHRRRSSPVERPERPTSGVLADDELGDLETSPPSGSNSSRNHGHRRGPSEARGGSDHDQDPMLRHSKSHEPTPNKWDAEDYFGSADYASPTHSAHARRSSAHDKPTTPPVTYNDVGPSFGPSASPLFASHVAKHPQPPPPAFQVQRPPYAPGHGPPPPGTDAYGGGPPLRNPSLRRVHAQGKYASRSPDPAHRGDRRYASLRPDDYDTTSGPYDAGSPEPQHGSSYGGSPYPPLGGRYADGPPAPRDPRARDARYSALDNGPPPARVSRDVRRASDAGRPPPRDRRDVVAPPHNPRDRGLRDRDPRVMDNRDRRGSRQSDYRSETDDYYSDEGRRDDRRRIRPPKHTRFAETGVSGRRYPDEPGYRRGSGS